MGFHRTLIAALGAAVFLTTFPRPLSAQTSERIFGRVTTNSGSVHEGWVRWDRNEVGWMDILDGSKKHEEFEYQDWWVLVHPGDRSRDRVIEVAGYRVTWDDSAPEFPENVESGIRFGHIRRLVPVDRQEVRLELRSGGDVVLTGGSTDLGTDLRGVLVTSSSGRTREFEWEDIESLDLSEGSARGTENGETNRLHGTVELNDGATYTGYVGWDLNGVLRSDTLTGFDSGGERHEILFERITEIRRHADEAEVKLSTGESLRLSDHDDVGYGNSGIQVSDPSMGMIDVDWRELAGVRFHAPEEALDLGSFPPIQRLRGTVVTSDSTTFSGWIRWDGDEEYSWELLDGQDQGGNDFDVEFSNILSMERARAHTVSLAIGAQGADVESAREEWTDVELRDGRVLQLDGSNDVDSSNHGIYVLPFDSPWAPDDEAAVWIMIGWDDFRSVRFEWGGER
jgi:hypothetical protein